MNGEKETWSRSEETWAKVGAILNGGIIAQVESKQSETRAYLLEVEERLNEIIRRANADTEEDTIHLPDSAAVLPTGTVNQEIAKAIAAINLISDKELKFRLTTFVDDYRRILHQNREPEKAQIVEELDEYFEKGSLDFVDMEIETEEMKMGLHKVQEEAQKALVIKEEVLSRLDQFKKELDEEKAIKEAMRAFQASTRVSAGISQMKKSPADEIIDIISRPKVIQALGPEDYAIIMNYIESNSHKQKKTKGAPAKEPPKEPVKEST